jgi:polar amino acid transport system ATP-binding protein
MRLEHANTTGIVTIPWRPRFFGEPQRRKAAAAAGASPGLSAACLFDEVTSALDPELVGEVLSVIRKLGAEHNLTLLMVTHQMSFAREFADRVCFFDRGKTAEQGVPAEMFASPRNERTQQFFSAVLEAG